eukprot:84224_1
MAAATRYMPRILWNVSRMMKRGMPAYMKMSRIKPRRSLTYGRHVYSFMHRPRSLMYGGLVASAFGASIMISHNRSAKCAQRSRTNVELLTHLRELAPVIEASKMLKLFLKEFNTPGGYTHVTEDFVVELFQKCGIEDAEIGAHLFKLMDWNHNGRLEPAELAATFTLFQVGSDVQRFKFLFRCLDLDRSRTVDKQEFRAFVTALLEAKYRLSGLKNLNEPDELYEDISYDEYRTIAKIKANSLVREIFLFADQNRDGELNMKEFLHWCNRGGKQVAVLQDILSHVCDEATLQ